MFYLCSWLLAKIHLINEFVSCWWSRRILSTKHRHWCRVTLYSCRCGKQFKLHAQFRPSGCVFWIWEELICRINITIFVLWMPVHEKDTMDFAEPLLFVNTLLVQEFKECFTGFVLLPLRSARVSVMTQWDHKEAVQCKILLKQQ